MIHEIILRSTKRDEMINITSEVQKILDQAKVREGLAVIFSSHTTAGITINENADPDVQKDFLRRLNEIYPYNQANDRHMEGNSAAHLKTSTVGVSQTLIVHNGKLLLGKWQGIYFCEFDGPQMRKCYVKILS